MRLSKAESTKVEKQILKSFPNTYTYTKNLGEKLIVKKKGNLKVVICRPSIIASAL